jgi:hypothetical protein
MKELNEQIEEWNLPTRLAKAPDPEARKYSGPAVELDATPPDRLVTLVEHTITDLIDKDAWAKEQAADESEREILQQMAGMT